ncbi:MAG: hypothetical protein KC777_19410 [Cyanobacteria bacterium HKST-UBA02]|nr:hypothetical protein [Cyanobacteria bacterium HKST-UBA02]
MNPFEFFQSINTINDKSAHPVHNSSELFASFNDAKNANTTSDSANSFLPLLTIDTPENIQNSCQLLPWKFPLRPEQPILIPEPSPIPFPSPFPEFSDLPELPGKLSPAPERERSNRSQDDPASPSGSDRDCPGTDLIGKPIKELDPSINPRLGCALAVSTALHEQHPEIPVTTNNKVLEAALKKNGYEIVETNGELIADDLQPGDVLIGKRPFGMPGHAAIYRGNGKIIENNSDTGTITGDGDLGKFNKGMHYPDGRWNKNGFDSVLVLRRKNATH